MFDFDSVIERHGTGSEKWDKYRGRDVIPMWVADMDFRSPPAVVDALRQRVEHGVFGYTGPTPEVVEAVVEMLARDHGWAVDPGWVVWLPGLVSGLNVTCRAVGEPGDDVLTLVPVYPPFLSAPRNSGRSLVRVPMQSDGNRGRSTSSAWPRPSPPAPGSCFSATPTTRWGACSTGRSWNAWPS